MDWRQKCIDLCDEIVRRLTETEADEWWHRVQHISHDFDESLQHLQLSPGKSHVPGLLIVSVETGQELPERFRAYQALLRINESWNRGTIMLARDPMQPMTQGMLLFAQKPGITIPGTEGRIAAKAKAIEVTKDWMRFLKSRGNETETPQQEPVGNSEAAVVHQVQAENDGDTSKRAPYGSPSELLRGKLNQSHGYSGGKLKNNNKVGDSQELATELKISPAAVSSWFKKWFKSRRRYNQLCEEDKYGLLQAIIRSINADVLPGNLVHVDDVEALRDKRESDPAIHKELPE